MTSVPSTSTSQAAPSAEDMAAAFASDPRVHFSKASGKWEYEDEEGREFEWSAFAKNWVPIVSLIHPSVPSEDSCEFVAHSLTFVLLCSCRWTTR